MTIRDHLLNGYADSLALTPWLHSPISFDDWKAGAADTAESSAYWKGFDSGVWDAFAKARR